MYTILENARIVLSLLKQHKIRHIVLSPGGSNIPIVQGVQQDSFFICHSVVDERSAMYFAIGLYQQTGEIIATSCTSAQATRNYIPGLTEAFYKHAPILAITMSKHPKYLGQDYMQCPIQTSLPVDAVKKSFSLPRINDEHDRTLVVRAANEAILELTHNGNGPVQMNIEELDCETWHFNEAITELPNVRCIRRYNYWNQVDKKELHGKKVMLVIGDHLPFTEAEQRAIETFCETNNVYVYTNLVSNYRSKYALNGNLALTDMTQAAFVESYMPDLVITIGALTGDYAIYSSLLSAPACHFPHWRVDLDGKVIDTYGKLTRVYQMRVEDFFSKYTQDTKCSDHGYFDLWRSRVDSLNYDVDIPLSNLYAAIKLSKRIPSNSTLTLAIHNSLRVWNYMQIKQPVVGLSPVNAFGIDGATSMSIGASSATDNLNFLITGDLAYLYDLNALSIRDKKNNIRILLCNNNGGFEFYGLDNRVDRSKYVAAYDHFKDSKGWAETNGFEYIKVSTKEEFDKAATPFVSHSDKPILIEIMTSQQNESKAYGLFMHENWKGSKEETLKRETKDKIKYLIKNTIGESGFNAIKGIVSR